MNRQTRQKRFNLLLHVLRLHQQAKGEPVKLNGAERKFRMLQWDCGTTACAHGSYCLTPYGRKYFRFFGVGPFAPLLRQRSRMDSFYDAAKHFGIDVAESIWVFSPDTYKSMPVKPHIVIRRVRSLMKRYGLEETA